MCADGLHDVASKLNVSAQLLIQANPEVSDPKVLYPGQNITIPHPENNYTALVIAEALLGTALSFNINADCLLNATGNDTTLSPAIINVPDSCGPFAMPKEVTVNALSVITVASDLSGDVAAAPITGCGLGLLSCDVIDPTRNEAPWHGSTESYPQCYDPSLYVCAENFLCPVNSPKIDGVYACGPYRLASSSTLSPGSPGTSDSSFTSISGSGVSSGSASASGSFSLTFSTTSTTTTEEIIFDGTTYTITPGSSTAIVDQGQTIVIGPSGIEIGGSEVAFPTSPITITTNGATLTFDTPSPTTVPNSSEISASQPISGSASPTKRPSSSVFASTSESEIVIGGTTYVVGISASTVIDHSTTYIVGGSTGGVIVGTQGISLPTGLTGLTTITSNGLTLTLGATTLPISPSVSSSASESDIVIGGTTYPIGTALTTIIDHGTTIVISGGDVVIDSQTVMLPTGITGETTITSNGATITVGVGAPGSTPSSQSATETTITSNGVTTTLGPSSTSSSQSVFETTITTDNATITLGPAGPSSSSQATSETEIVIGGTTFVVGSSASTVTGDGTTFIIGGSSGGVVVGTQTISFPTGISSLTTITTDGVTLTLGAGKPLSTDPIGDLEGLKPEVGALAGFYEALSGIGSAMDAGSLADGAAISQLSDLSVPMTSGMIVSSTKDFSDTSSSWRSIIGYRWSSSAGRGIYLSTTWCRRVSKPS